MERKKNKVGRPKLTINEKDLQRELKKYMERKANSNNYIPKFRNSEKQVFIRF